MQAPDNEDYAGGFRQEQEFVCFLEGLKVKDPRPHGTVSNVPVSKSQLHCLFRGPLLPHRRISQHLHVNTADNRTRLESNLPSIGRFKPVAEGNARG